jgi:hypothetical protein
VVVDDKRPRRVSHDSRQPKPAAEPRDEPESKIRRRLRHGHRFPLFQRALGVGVGCRIFVQATDPLTEIKNNGSYE